MVRHYWVWEKIDANEVAVRHVGNEGMPADGLTKVLVNNAQLSFARLVLGGTTPDGVLDSSGATRRTVSWKPRKTKKGQDQRAEVWAGKQEPVTTTSPQKGVGRHLAGTTFRRV